MTLPASLSLAAYTQESSVISGGGGTSSSGSYTLTGTIGQPVVGLATDSSYSNHSGFWNLRTGDTIPPIISGFSLASPVHSRVMPFDVPITSLTASDVESGVTGYYFSSSPTAPTDAWGSGWNAPTPASIQLAGKGPQTYYVWARDAAGNISSNSVSAPTTTILQYLLIVSLAGSGGISISSSPAGIGCSAGTPDACSAPFDENAIVALTGNPDRTSELVTWIDAVTSTSNPVDIAMSANKNAVGSFAAVTLPARIVYGKGYDTLTSLLPAIGADCTIETRSDSYPAIQTETLLFSKNYNITLIGGRDANWAATGNLTTVKGKLKVSSGRLTAQGIRLKQ